MHRAVACAGSVRALSSACHTPAATVVAAGMGGIGMGALVRPETVVQATHSADVPCGPHPDDDTAPRA